MYGGWTEYAILWTNFLGFILDVWLLSLSAKSTFKIMNLVGSVFRIGFFKLLNNDDEKLNKNSTVN